MQILLATPSNLDPSGPALARFKGLLEQVAGSGTVSALLLRKGKLAENGYGELTRAILPIARQGEMALLLEDTPHLVRPWGADGVHMNSGQAALAGALKDLKPDFIVGAGNVGSRHQAMLRGEAGADYICFGSLQASPDETALALGQWWSDLFEIPCAVFDNVTPISRMSLPVCEFAGLGDNVWNAPDGPLEALREVSNAVRTGLEKAIEGQAP